MVRTRRPLVQVPDLPTGRQAQLLVLYGLVLLWRDLDDHGGIVEAARRMGRKADGHDARGHRLLVDLQQLDPKVVRIGALKTVDGPEARLDLVVGWRQAPQLPRPAAKEISTSLPRQSLQGLVDLARSGLVRSRRDRDQA